MVRGMHNLNLYLILNQGICLTQVQSGLLHWPPTPLSVDYFYLITVQSVLTSYVKKESKNDNLPFTKTTFSTV